jgi:hypothetical protein
MIVRKLNSEVNATLFQNAKRTARSVCCEPALALGEVTAVVVALLEQPLFLA